MAKSLKSSNRNGDSILLGSLLFTKKAYQLFPYLLYEDKVASFS